MDYTPASQNILPEQGWDTIVVLSWPGNIYEQAIHLKARLLNVSERHEGGLLVILRYPAYASRFRNYPQEVVGKTLAIHGCSEVTSAPVSTSSRTLRLYASRGSVTAAQTYGLSRSSNQPWITARVFAAWYPGSRDIRPLGGYSSPPAIRTVHPWYRPLRRRRLWIPQSIDPGSLTAAYLYAHRELTVRVHFGGQFTKVAEIPDDILN